MYNLVRGPQKHPVHLPPPSLPLPSPASHFSFLLPTSYLSSNSGRKRFLPYVNRKEFGAFLEDLNPHLVFQEFLENFGYDHTLLLDFLISCETEFLSFIWKYVNFLVDGWSEFVLALEAEEEEGEEEDEYGRDEREQRGGSKEPMGRKRRRDERYGDKEGLEGRMKDEGAHEDGEGEEEGMRPKGLQKEKADQSLSCLIRLKYAIENLQEKSLFPYNISPLLKLLAVVEALYEDLNLGGEEGSNEDSTTGKDESEEEDHVEMHDAGFSLVSM
jgi:hypothetical protein